MIKFYDQLKLATSEEDVKDAYIRELGLTRYNKGKVDILTDEVWFEAKMGGDVSYYKMFTQLLHYVYVADKEGKQKLPKLLAVIDQQKAALMKTADIIDFLRKDTIEWGKSASNPNQEAVDEVSKFIGVHFVRYNIKTHGYDFRFAVRHFRENNKFPHRKIKPNNLKQVFDVWVEMIGRKIINADGSERSVDESKYVELFFADIMTYSGNKVATHSKLAAKLVSREEKPAFFLGGELYDLSDTESYHEFWDIYARPPDKEDRDYLLARRDSLIPLDERIFKGAFFTPLDVVNKAYETLTKTLGEDWQEEYIVWDMCCGVGNLEVKHSNHRKVFMSTLDKVDVELMVATNTCVASEPFQYDYLNDDINSDGEIDYTLTNKIPANLQKAIKKGKKILVLMNPPYAEATNATNINKDNKISNKAGVAKTTLAKVAMQNYGKASKELYTQFLARIAKEMPTATIAMFSTLKHVNAPNFEEFRQNWNAKYLDGFIVHSKAFDGLKGDFPIGFLIWKTYNGTKQNHTINKIFTEKLSKKAEPIGDKLFYNIPNKRMLNKWIDRPRANSDPALPLKNAISPSISENPRVTNWSDDAKAYMYCGGNDMQHAGQQTALFSSTYGGGNGFYVTRDNLDKAAMTFTVRRIIKHEWEIHNDQFLIPTGELTDEFKNDCLIWMLFDTKNVTASADGLEWDGTDWSLVNHFIPFKEAQVNAPARFESDFMVQYLKDKKLSAEAESVMEQGQILWQTYFSKKYSPKVRDQYKLDRPDVGWYQIRQAIKEYNKERDTGQVRFTDFNESYQTLSDKLRPMVFDLGFLPR